MTADAAAALSATNAGAARQGIAPLKGDTPEGCLTAVLCFVLSCLTLLIEVAMSLTLLVLCCLTLCDASQVGEVCAFGGDAVTTRHCALQPQVSPSQLWKLRDRVKQLVHVTLSTTQRSHYTMASQ